VEAHYAAGGLGSLVAEAAAEAGIGCRVVRCAVHAAPDGVCGSQAHLCATHGFRRMRSPSAPSRLSGHTPSLACARAAGLAACRSRHAAS